MRVAILTVSDRGSHDRAYDRSGPTIRAWLETNFVDAHEILHQEIVPDEIDAIQKTILLWTDQNGQVIPDLILTTGGTGFAARDITPEAISPLLEKHASGIVAAIMKGSLDITPLAMLSRPVAGVRGRTLIVTLPGSPKACVENLNIIGKALPHAVELLSSSGSPTGGHHHHHHHHHVQRKSQCRCTAAGAGIPADASSSTAGLNRHSAWPMIPVDDAQSIVEQRARMLQEIVDQPVGIDLVGHVLAEDIFSPAAVPAFSASMVDGYAVQSSNDDGIFSVSKAILAGEQSVTLTPGTVCRITTGAPIPQGADAVIMIEETSLVEASADGGEEISVRLHRTMNPGDNIRPAGSDITKGELLLRKHHCISTLGGEIGLLVSAGIKNVRVFRRPRVAIFSTGNEIRDHMSASEIHGSEVWDANRPMLEALLKHNASVDVIDLGICEDRESLITEKYKEALASADIVITTGGVSMGESDYIKAIMQKLGAEIHFGRINMKPGKPTTFATLGQKLLFGLPGNPVSAAVTALLLVVLAIRSIGGDLSNGRKSLRVELKMDATLDIDRPEYRRVVLKLVGDKIGAYPVDGSQQSSRIMSLAGANGFILLPSQRQSGKQTIPAGETVPAFLFGNIQ